MAWYATDYRIQKNGELVGMALAGPFKTRAEADAAHTAGDMDGCLTVGPDDLGPEWENNIERWRDGDLI